jgi:ribulose 1,5-bisphosphate synthetase/thiazole synthase
MDLLAIGAFLMVACSFAAGDRSYAREIEAVTSAQADLATPEESTDVVIIGAGLAGLVTAYELQKHGVHTHILETRAARGGRVSTTDYGNSLLAEYGMQEIWANNPLIKIAEELGVDLVSEYEH